MDNLIEDRIVENRFLGRSNHYYLTAETAFIIEKLMSQAPVMMHSGVEAVDFQQPLDEYLIIL